MGREYISLFELQTALREGIESIVPSRVWVKAEISAMKARRGSHCYLELSESGENGMVAKVKAVVWANNWRILEAAFREEAGTDLAEGMNVLLQVQVTYSQLYGLSLVVWDIDAVYTLGEAERLRRETLARLEAEGLLELQKTLEPVRVPYNIAVVSAEDAAGYRDFLRHLHENEYGFAFSTTLFPAKMQGLDAPSSMREALESVAASGVGFDYVMILRGGGSKLDLACFDDYDLAVAIATFPIPVMTAVGHDQDYHVCDAVAYDFMKTPTALADRLLEALIAEDEAVSYYGTRLKLAFMTKINAMGSRIDILENRILSADPRNVLKRGYTLVTDGCGKVRKKASDFGPGDVLEVLFSDGKVKCKVL